MSQTIRVEQWLRERPYRTYNHAFTFIAKNAAGEWLVNQAQAAGTLQCPLSKVVPGGTFVAISADSFPTVDRKPIDRSRVIAASNARLGEEYGFIEIASILCSDATPRWVHIDFSRPGTLICSAYVAKSLEGGGALFFDNPLVISPARLAHLAADYSFTVTPPE